jgi:NitT/TauT family transport system substrate-binding protein
MHRLNNDTTARKRAPLVMSVLVLTVAMAISACGGDTTDSTSGTDDAPTELTPVILQMHFLPQLDWGGYLYGIENGIFEEHGIDLEMVPGQGSAFTMQQLNEDQAQFGSANILAYLADRAGTGSETTGVYVVTGHPQVGMLTTVPDADSLDDLAGHTLGLIPFSAWRSVLPVVLQENGLEPDSVEVELVTYSIALLLEGQVDALEVYQGSNLASATAAAEEGGAEVSFLDMADFGFVGYSQTIVARNDVIESDPELVSRMLAAIRQSYDEAFAQDDQAIIDMVVGLYPELASDYAVEDWAQYKTLVSETGLFDTEVVATSLGYVADGMGIPHDLQAEDVFTNEFVPTG